LATAGAPLVAMMDLRMAGYGNLRRPLTEMQKKAQPKRLAAAGE